MEIIQNTFRQDANKYQSYLQYFLSLLQSICEKKQSMWYEYSGKSWISGLLRTVTCNNERKGSLCMKKVATFQNFEIFSSATKDNLFSVLLDA
jgi:hypothetical protein